MTHASRPSLEAMLTRAVFGPLCLALLASLVALVMPRTGVVTSIAMALLWMGAAAWGFVQVQRCVWAVEHPLSQAIGTIRAMAGGHNPRVSALTGIRETDRLTEALADLHEYLSVMVADDDEITQTPSASRPAAAPSSAPAPSRELGAVVTLARTGSDQGSYTRAA